MFCMLSAVRGHTSLYRLRLLYLRREIQQHMYQLTEYHHGFIQDFFAWGGRKVHPVAQGAGFPSTPAGPRCWVPEHTRLAQGAGFPSTPAGPRCWVPEHTRRPKVLGSLAHPPAQGAGFPSTPAGPRCWVPYYL